MKRKLKKKAWEWCSKWYRILKPKCEICGKPSQCVHHIIPRARGNIVYFDERNLLSLCKGCHYSWHNKWSINEQKCCLVECGRNFDWHLVEGVKYETKKYTAEDYERMILNYKNKIKELNNE